LGRSLRTACFPLIGSGLGSGLGTLNTFTQILNVHANDLELAPASRKFAYVRVSGIEFLDLFARAGEADCCRLCIYNDLATVSLEGAEESDVPLT
jgi:hypothetical protein